MKISKQARRDAKALFRVCLVEGLPDENRVHEIVQRVIASRPRGYLAILAHLKTLLKLDMERRAARVESAAPLAPDLQASIRSWLARVYGSGLQISFTPNATLLGGMRIRVASDVFDGSVQARLQALERSF